MIDLKQQMGLPPDNFVLYESALEPFPILQTCDS